jgi:hypothetical protein
VIGEGLLPKNGQNLKYVASEAPKEVAHPAAL